MFWYYFIVIEVNPALQIYSKNHFFLGNKLERLKLWVSSGRYASRAQPVFCYEGWGSSPQSYIILFNKWLI